MTLSGIALFARLIPNKNPDSRKQEEWGHIYLPALVASWFGFGDLDKFANRTPGQTNL